MENSAIKKEHFIEYLSFVSLCESEKSISEINTDLITACTNISLKLQGKSFTLSPEQIKERVEKIPFILSADFGKEAPQNTKKHISKKRILLIAAVIALLCVLLTVFSIGQNIDFSHAYINEKFGSIFNVPVGETIPIGDQELVYTGESNSYDSTKDFFNHEKYNVLLPGALPEGIELTRIISTPYNSTITVSFNSAITAYEIQLNASMPDVCKKDCEETMQINDITCYVDKMHEINHTQIYFEHNGNSYLLGCVSNNEEQLIDIIEGLVDRNTTMKK